MKKSVATCSDSELAKLTGLDRRVVPVTLAAAGLAPVRTTRRGPATLREWPRAAALAALKRSAATAIKTSRSGAAGHRATAIEIEEQLAAGTRIRISDFHARLDELLLPARDAMVAMTSRYSSAIAAINGEHLPAVEREAKIRATLQPSLDHIAKLKEAAWTA